MSESLPTEPESPDVIPFIETVYFDEWAPPGGPVALLLSPRCTVLVGRNGGGKSLLLEGIRDGARGGNVPSRFKRRAEPKVLCQLARRPAKAHNRPETLPQP